METLAEDEFWASSGVLSANDFRRMLDVEYVSELAVAFLHGHQNKKDALDNWYKVYEPEFSDRSRIEHVFRNTTGELAQILPDMRRTRWRNKSDFYSLFLAFAARAEDLPLASEKRDVARDLLLDFSDKVSRYLTQLRAGGSPRSTRSVRMYAGAVRAAATDLKNREIRAAELDALLTPVFDS